MALSAQSLQAEDRTWRGTTGSDWTEDGNWDPSVPASDTDVIIGAGQNAPVIADGDSGVADHLQINADGTLQVDGELELSTGATVEGELTIGTGTVTGDVTTSAGGTTTVMDGGDLIGDVLNQGITDIEGILTGNLTNESQSAISGTVTGNVLAEAGSETGISGSVGGNLTGAAGSTIGLTGTAIITGDVETEGGIDLAGEIGGALTLTGDAVADTAENVSVGGLTSNGAVLNVNDGVIFSGDVTTTADGITTVMEGGELIGDVLNQGITDIEGILTGNLTNESQSAISGTVTGNVLAEAGSETGISGSVGGSLTGAEGSAIGLTGTAIITGDVETEGGIDLAGEIGGALTLTGDAVADTAGNVSVGGLTSNGAVLNVKDGVIFSGDVTTTADGITTVMEGGELIGDVLNQGITDIEGILTGDLTNEGVSAISGTVTGNVLAEAGSETGISGSVGGSVTGAEGSAIGLTGTAIITGDVETEGGIDLAGEIGGTLTLIGDALANTDGDVSVDGLTSNGAVLNVNDGGSFTGDVTTTAGGTTTVLEGGALIGDVLNQGITDIEGILTGDLTNESQSAISGTVTGNVQAEAGSETGISGSVGGNLTGAAGSAIGLTGTAIITGDVETEGGIDLAGEIGGALTLIGDAVADTAENVSVGGLTSNGAVLNVNDGGSFTGDVTTTAGGTTTVLEGGELIGDVLNQGITDIAGILTGDLTNEGVSSVTGTLTGILTNSGQSTISGTVNGAVSSTAGSTTTLTGGVTGTVANDGTLVVGDGASVSGVITNQGSLTATIPGGTELSFSAGAVDNYGSIGSAAAGSGTLVVNAASIILREGSSLVGDVSLRGAITSHIAMSFGAGSPLYGSYTNAGSGQLTVDGALDAGGFGISNAGLLSVEANIGNLASLTNSGTAVLAAGTTLTTAQVTNAAGGTLTAAGTITGGLSNAGTAELTGTVGGDLANSGTLSVQGAVGGAFTNSASGSATVTGVTEAGSVGNSGAMTIADAASLTSSGPVTNAFGATLTLAGSLTGTLENSGTTRFTGGVLSGDLSSSGTLTAAGVSAVSGAIGVTGGSFAVETGADMTAGAVSVAGPASLTLGGTLRTDLANAGSLAQDGTLEGSLTNTGTASLSGLITGNLIQQAGVASIGTLQVDGAVSAGTDMAIATGQSLSAGSYGIAAGTTTAVTGLLQTQTGLSNAGALSLGDGGRVSGAVSGGNIYALGTTAIEGALSNATLISLTGSGGTASGDLLRVSSLSGAGTVLAFDINLDAGAPASGVDLLQVDGAVSGEFYLNFTDHTDQTAAERSIGDLVLISAGDTSAMTISGHSGLLDSSLRYSHALVQDNLTGEVLIRTELDPAIAGVAGSVALSQSLIGAIVNRPTSPYTVGRAVPDESDNCAPGTWARATGGRATLTGDTSASAGGTDSNYGSKISVSYGGMQVGTDLSCFNGSIAGWDMAFGAIVGVNRGSGTQSSGNLGENIISTTAAMATSNKFDQTYLGIYATASKGRLIADLQLRGEKTDFELTNEGIGLSNGKLDVKAVTLSGALTAHIPLGENGWSVLPTGGFMISRSKSSDLAFDTGDVLTIADHTTKLGFAGVALSKLNIAESGDQATSYFVTGTYYHDFSDEMTSSYLINGTTDPFSLSTSVLGSYGEVSVGVNYLKVLSQGANGNAASQFNAALRLDGRFSDNLDGVALTGQVRWQF